MASSPIAFKHLTVTIDNVTVVTLASLGLTDDDIRHADVVHISVSGDNIHYWYSNSGLAVTTSTGHVVTDGSERVFHGIVTARFLQMIAETSSATLAITISKY